ncbi:unnamed protein product [Chrysoparadoxa australica]
MKASSCVLAGACFICAMQTVEAFFSPTSSTLCRSPTQGTFAVSSSFHGARCACPSCSPKSCGSGCSCPSCASKLHGGSCSCPGCRSSRCTGACACFACRSGMVMQATQTPEAEKFKALLSDSTKVKFQDTMDFVADNFKYTPKRFNVGSLASEAGVNEGSSKVFSLSQLLDLSDAETLRCFGEHYVSVTEDPDGDAHGNIRAFMKTGAAGVGFPDGLSLKKKEN